MCRLMATISKLTVTDAIFLNNNLGQRKIYECPVCEHLLRDAVQISCGHWFCRDCGGMLFRKSSKPVCPRGDCDEELELEDGKEYFPDKFVRKEIGKFHVRCLYHTNACPWIGNLLQLEHHLATCNYELQECEYCHGQFEKTKFNDHIMICPKALVSCPFVQYGCEVSIKMTRAEYDKHLKAEVASHSKIVASLLERVSQLQFDCGKEHHSSDLASLWSLPTASFRGKPVILSQRVQSDGPGAMSGDDLLVESISQTELQHLKKQLATKESQIRHLQDKLQQMICRGSNQSNHLKLLLTPH